MVGKTVMVTYRINSFGVNYTIVGRVVLPKYVLALSLSREAEHEIRGYKWNR